MPSLRELMKQKLKEQEIQKEKSEIIGTIEIIDEEYEESVKLIVPKYIKILFDYIDKSISSNWGLQKNGNIKYDSKYTIWIVFKEWFKTFYVELRDFECLTNKINDEINGKIDRFIESERKRDDNLIKHFSNLESKLEEIRRNQLERLQEKSFQNLLIKFPQIIELGLTYLEREYGLGNSNYRGDILFLDVNSKKLNVETKVNVQSFNGFKDQLLNKYINNIDMAKERLMYIVPKISKEQKEICIKYNIEMKEIDLNKTLKR